MTEILEIFSLLLNTDKFQKCQTDNKKSSKSFSDLLLSLAAGGRLVFCFEHCEGRAALLAICPLITHQQRGCPCLLLGQRDITLSSNAFEGYLFLLVS